MKNKVRALLGVLVLFTASLCGAQTMQVRQTGLQDAQGNLASNVTVCAQAVANGRPISVRLGSNAGVTITRPVCATVSNGAWVMQLPDGAVSSPMNTTWSLTATDNTTGDNLLTGYSSVQPHSKICSPGSCTPLPVSDWCSSGACVLDQLDPSAPAMAVVVQGPQGNKGDPGCDVTSPNCHTAIVADPTTSQALAQPSGTTLSVNSLNKVLWADSFAGADIGAKINAAFAANKAAGNACGTVSIAPGAYSFATQINKPRCAVLEGNGAQLTFIGTSGFALRAGSAPEVNYTMGSIRSLRIISGNQATDGVYLGTLNGDGVEEYMDTFQDVVVYGFVHNYNKGPNTYQLTFLGGGSTQATATGWYDHSGFGSENMAFFGWQDINNHGLGFDATAPGGSQYNFTNCSFDYNLGGAFSYLHAVMRFFGGHMEQSNGKRFIDSPVTDPSDLSEVSLFISGLSLNWGGPAIDAPIHIGGRNSYVYIADGLNIFHSGSSASELVLWEANGQSNELTVGSYFDPTAPNGVTIPPVNAGANIQWLEASRYKQYTPTSKYFTNIVARIATINAPSDDARDGMVTAVNLNGVQPVYGRDCATSAIGWNGSANTRGEADYQNCFPSNQAGLTGGDYAHQFWSFDGANWNTVGGFTRDGHVVAPNGYSGGWSGTCSKVVVTNGIVTGCAAQ